MKKHILILGLLLSACSQQQPVKKQQERKPKEEKISPTISYNSPALFAGTTFLQFLQASSNAQRYDLMLKFTADSILNCWGKDSVRNYYERFDFGFKIIKLKSMIHNGNRFTLLYLTNSIATKKQMLIQCIIENDSAKIILPIQMK